MLPCPVLGARIFHSRDTTHSVMIGEMESNIDSTVLLQHSHDEYRLRSGRRLGWDPL